MHVKRIMASPEPKNIGKRGNPQRGIRNGATEM
jgi:hypothetical protein